MEIGSVKWYNEAKGYGFIVPDQGNGDVFFHVTTLAKSGIKGVVEGQRIRYDLRINETTKKRSAINIQLVNPLPQSQSA